MEFFLGFFTGVVVISFFLFCVGKYRMSKPNGLVIYYKGERIE
jgi:hypothetical protein